MHKKIIIIVGAVMTPIIFVFIIGAFLAAVVGGSAAGSQSNTDDGGDGTLSAEVLAYQPIVSQYCSKYGIPDYVLLVLSVMQQESGGSRKDLMQCSECPLNTKYPNKPNSITDPKYSIEIGTEYLASCLRAALRKSPSDIPGISLALQGYNFGGGYISWAFEHGGGYSQANAIQFSELKAKDLNCKSYGDPQYVNRVLKYYNFNSTGSGTFGYPLKPGTYSITRGTVMTTVCYIKESILQHRLEQTYTLLHLEPSFLLAMEHQVMDIADMEM